MPRCRVSVPEAPGGFASHSAGPVQVPLSGKSAVTAVAEAADSSPIPEARITWELSDTSVAAFDRTSGVLTPKALGTTTLTARLAGIQPAAWTVQIIPGDIELQPARVGMAPGRRTTLSAFLRDEKGATAGRATGVRGAQQLSCPGPEAALSRPQSRPSRRHCHGVLGQERNGGRIRGG